MTEPAFFSQDPNGRRQDAGLHADMLDNPAMDDLIARQTIALAVETGTMTLADAIALYGTDPIRIAFETDGVDPRSEQPNPPSA